MRKIAEKWDFDFGHFRSAEGGWQMPPRSGENFGFVGHFVTISLCKNVI